ncbi:MAG: ribonuclease R [Bacteroidales bacterium]|nr:ribonuclease R [Bacteroidales bacterium]
MARNKKTSSSKGSIAKSSFVNSVISVFTMNPHGVFNFRQVSAQLGISDKASKDVVKSILESLAQKKEVVEMNQGKYQLSPEKHQEHIPLNIVTGKVDMKQTGKAYIITTDLNEDVFIAANNTGRALHGDKVKAHLFPKRMGRKLEGEIIEIVSRARIRFVGTIHIAAKYAFVVCDDITIPVDIMVLPENMKGAKNGQKVVVNMLEWPEHANNPLGEITDVLGTPGDNEVEMKSILVNHNFPLVFPQEAETEAERIKDTIGEEEIKSRRDFRDLLTFTIDPEDAKDFDDALSLTKLNNGLWEVGVHIADVSHYVKPTSAIEAEGYERGTSIYLVDRTIPMLPAKLSEMVCSLRPYEEKLCFSTVFKMDENAKVLDQWFGKTVIKSNRRYNYEEVQAMIEGGEGDYKDELMVLHGLAQKMRNERFKGGAINFHSVEVKFKLDENAKPISTYIKENKEANWLIEEFMLLANRRVAEFVGVKKGESNIKAFVYRIHDVPNPEKLSRFSEFLGKLGYNLKTGTRKGLAHSFNRLFEQIAGKGEANMIESIAIRTMAKAEYSTQNIGHYGLDFKYYTHFTSPIRRYPDLMVHRLLECYLAGKPSVSAEEYEPLCQHSSEMEKRAEQAERDSVKYKQAEFMMDKIGQEFFGLVSGVSKWGIFVEIEGNKCEGMVSLKYMNDDFYYLDEDNYRVVGQRHGQEYKLGDRVKIKVRKVDLQKKQMDFMLVGDGLKGLEKKIKSHGRHKGRK